MKKPNIVVKLAVIASSVVLIAGFVSYRAGAFNWSKPASPQPADPAATNSDDSLVPPTIMSGTKSTFTPASVPPIQRVEPSVIMGSSKSLAPLIPSSASKPPATTQQPAQPQK